LRQAGAFNRDWPVVLAIILLAAALRFPALGQAPPGLYQDEAWNGLDALQVLQGARPLYFAANNGREPLFIYLVALAVGALGPSPAAIRLVAAVLGTLTIPATYALGRTWFNRRVGWLAAAILAITFWHVHLSRIGFRAVALPLIAAAALAAGWRGFLPSPEPGSSPVLGGEGPGVRAADRRWLILGGALYGLSFYTYLAARFTPLALAGFGLYLVWRQAGNIRLRALVWFIAAALAVMAPLAVYAVQHPEIVFARANEVLITHPEINKGDLWGTLGRHLLAVLGMFTFRGDTIWRHNLAGRPVFDPLLALAFAAGVILCLARFRRQPTAAFTLIWTGVMLLPTLLAEDAPHFLRAVGVLPVAVLFPALGLDAAWAWLGRHSPAWVGAVLAALVLSASLGLTVQDYFGDYVHNPVTGYYFQSAAAALAAEVNRTIGAGWDGQALHVPAHSPPTQGRVVLARRFWESFASIRYLVPETPNLVIADSPAQVPPGVPLRLFLWPYEPTRAYLEALPRGIRLSAQWGPLARGDLEPQPYALYVVYSATPARPETDPLARFEHGIALLSAQVSRTTSASGQPALRVDLSWSTTQPIPEDYTVFVHVENNGQVVAQHDGPPGAGALPTSWWRPGDAIEDTHLIVLEVPDPTGQIIVGLYHPVTLQRLARLDASGQPASNSAEIK